MPPTILTCTLPHLFFLAVMTAGLLLPASRAAAQPGPNAVLGDEFGVARISLPLPAEAREGAAGLETASDIRPSCRAAPEKSSIRC